MDWDYDTYIYVVSCHGNHSSPISPSWVSCPAIWLSHQHAVSSAQATWLSAQAIKAVPAWLSQQHAVSSAQAIKAIPAWLSHHHAISSGSFHPLPLIIEFFMRLTFLLCQLERCIISWNMNVQRVCQKLNLLLRRNLFRRHDFAMAIQKLATSLTLFRTKYSIVLYIILQLCT